MDHSTRDKFVKWGTVGILLLIAVAFAIKWALGDPPPGPDGVAPGSRASINYARPGDCIADLGIDPEVVDKVDYVACSEPHTVEVVGQSETTATGTQEAAQEAASECTVIVTEATGKSPAAADAGYRMNIVVPSPANPAYLCIVEFDQPVTGLTAGPTS